MIGLSQKKNSHALSHSFYSGANTSVGRITNGRKLASAHMSAGRPAKNNFKQFATKYNSRAFSSQGGGRRNIKNSANFYNDMQAQFSSNNTNVIHSKILY